MVSMTATCAQWKSHFEPAYALHGCRQAMALT